jgi:hypothetical protein
MISLLNGSARSKTAEGTRQRLNPVCLRKRLAAEDLFTTLATVTRRPGLASQKMLKAG